MTDEQTQGRSDTVGRRGFPVRRLRMLVVVSAAIVGGFVGGAGSLALAAGSWHGEWGHGFRLEHMQRMVRGALDGVGATTVQEDKIHDLIAANFADGGQSREQHQAVRKQMLDLLRAPTIDRTAVEKIRSEQVADFDQRSRKTVGTILDIADQLTPDQRERLADRIATMAERRHDGDEHRWRGQDGMGRPDRDPMDQRPMRERPDDGNGQDKG